jgi:hypothetical protein
MKRMQRKNNTFRDRWSRTQAFARVPMPILVGRMIPIAVELADKEQGKGKRGVADEQAHLWNKCYFSHLDRLLFYAGRPRGPWPKPADWWEEPAVAKPCLTASDFGAP